MNDTQDNKWDKLLHIKTMGRDDSQSDQYRYPYEPTPYSVLQRLANTGLIRKNNMLLDYGCGKGRVDFFLSYQTRCRCLGVEYDERIYEKVMDNKKEAVSKERVSFSLANAEEFQLPEQIDRIYFFNPFSIEIFRKVVANIQRSMEKSWRKVTIILYYPDSEYTYFLEECTNFTLEMQIRLDECDKDPREGFLVYSYSESSFWI